MTLKEKIAAGKNICGTLVNIPATCITEMIGYVDFDYLWLDLEHSAITLDMCYNMLVGAKSAGREVIVRVPQHDLTYTKKVLEMGPDGIIFPMVKNAEEAEELISYTVYPPHGKRGCGPQRAVRYVMDDELEFFREGPKNLCRFLQIDCESFINDLDKIAQNPYIDGFILGLADLSGDIGEMGNFFGEKNLAVAQKAIDIARKHGKIVGSATLATDEENLSKLFKMGITMLTCGSDFHYVINGARNTLSAVRKVIG